MSATGEKPKMIRVLFSLATLCVAISVNGCAWVGGGAAGVVVGRTALALKRETPPEITEISEASVFVSDQGQKWHREIVTMDGREVALARYRQGDPLRLRWIIPLETSYPVEALVGGEDTLCRGSGQPDPSRWEIVAAEGTSVGEAWRVQRNEWTGQHGVGERRVVGQLRGAMLASKVGLPVGREVGWVLVLPRPGRYFLRLEWDNAEQPGTIDVQPCLRGWSAIPLSWALAVTAPEAPIGAPRESEAVGGQLVNTSDEGLSLLGAGLEEADTSSGREGVSGGRISAVQFAGTPDQDLLQLHQLALRFELELVRGQGGGSLSQAERAGLIELRAKQLKALGSMGAQGQIKLCLLGYRQGLAARKLRMWGGEFTIPMSYLESCGR